MSRPARIEFPDAVYRAMARGDRWKRFSVMTGSRSKFLGYLAEGAERCRVKVHGYVLMVNHQPGPSTDAPFSAWMILSASGENVSHVARKITSPFCTAAAVAEVSVSFPNSFMRPLSRLVWKGSKGLNNALCFSLLTYRFALTYKPHFGGTFILWEKDFGWD
jgi:hypothetical protein